MFRFGWRTFVAINVAAFLPIALVTAATSIATYGPMSDWQQLMDTALSGPTRPADAWAAFPLSSIALIVVASFLVGPFATLGQAALIDAIAAAVTGGSLSARRSFSAALARLPGILAIYLVLSVVGIAGAILGLGLPLLSLLPTTFGITGGPVVFIGLVVFVAVVAAIIFVAIRFAFAVMALMVERLPAGPALRRSWYLLSGSMLRFVGWALVFGLIVGVITVLVSIIALFISVIVSPPRLDAVGTIPYGSIVVETIATTLIGALVAPLSTIGMTLLYFEIRWRHREVVPAPG